MARRIGRLLGAAVLIAAAAVLPVPSEASAATTPRVTISAPSAVRSNARLVVSGTVTPRSSGAPVRLQRWSSHGWTSVGSTTMRRGAFRVSGAPRAGTYRVLAPRHGSRVSVWSGRFTVRLIRVRSVGGTLSRSTTWTSPSSEQVQLSRDLTVSQGVTLTIGPGVTVVADGNGITVRGRLVAGQGGRTVLESTRRRSLPDQWAGVRVLAGGSADLGASLVRGATVALDVEPGASAVWHGSVRATRTALIGDGFVDARSTDWGSPSGPSPYGSGLRVRGDQAQVVPWAGYSLPSPPASGSSQPAPVCQDVVLLAARGSNEAPQGSASYESDKFHGMGTYGYFAADAIEAALRDAGSAATLERRAIRYPALQFPAFTTSVSWSAYVRALLQGAFGLRDAVRTLASSCPSSRVVLVGASQGAAVVRLGLQLLTGDERARVVAVGLVGDLSRVAGGSETVWQSASTPITGQAKARSGLVAAPLLLSGSATALPGDVAARTLSLCHPTDVVCAAGPGSDIDGHLAYTADDAKAAYAWLSRKVLDALG